MAKLTLRRKKHKKSRRLQRKSLGKSRRLQRKSRIQRGGTKEKRFDEYYAEIKKCVVSGNETQGLCPSIMKFFYFDKNKLNNILTEREKDSPSLKQLICKNIDVRVVLNHEKPYFLKTHNPLFPNENGWHKIITYLHGYVHNDPSDKPDPQKLAGHVYNLLFPSAGTKTIEAAGAASSRAARPIPDATTGSTTGATAAIGATGEAAATGATDTRPYAPEGWTLRGNVWQKQNEYGYVPAETYKPRPNSEKVAAVDQLPEGWIALTDPASGKTYYANTTTSNTQWDKPNPTPNIDTESLPDGWVAGIDRDGIYYYVKADPTITSRTFPTTTGLDARLAAALNDD